MASAKLHFHLGLCEGGKCVTIVTRSRELKKRDNMRNGWGIKRVISHTIVRRYLDEDYQPS